MRQMFSGTFSLCPLFEGSFPLLKWCFLCCLLCCGQVSLEGQGGGRHGRWENSPAVTETCCGHSHADTRACMCILPAPICKDSILVSLAPSGLPASAGTDGSRETPRHIPLLRPPTPMLHITSPPCSPQPCQPPWRRDRVSCWPERALQTPGPLNSSLTGLDCPSGVGVCVCVVLGFPFPSKLCLMTPPTTRTLGSGQLAGGAVSTQCEWGAGGWGTLGMCGTFRVTSHIPQLFLCSGPLPSWVPCLRLLGKGRGGRSQEGAWPGV